MRKVLLAVVILGFAAISFHSSLYCDSCFNIGVAAFAACDRQGNPLEYCQKVQWHQQCACELTCIFENGGLSETCAAGVP